MLTSHSIDPLLSNKNLADLVQSSERKSGSPDYKSIAENLSLVARLSLNELRINVHPEEYRVPSQLKPYRKLRVWDRISSS